MHRKKLLYVVTRSHFGGVQSHVKDLLTHFCSKYEVHLATSAPGYLTEVANCLNVKVHFMTHLSRGLNPLKNILTIQECIKLIQGVQPNLIHIHSMNAGLAARIAGKICSVPTIYSSHGWVLSPGKLTSLQKIVRLNERLMALLSTRIICVSASDRQLALQHGIGREKQLVTVLNGIHQDAAPIANATVQPPRLIMVARFTNAKEHKDHVTLLQSIAQLKDPSIQLDLVGTGSSLESCRVLAQELGISDRVAFLGDRQDVPELLARSQIFVLTTYREGLPISILEAMRAGLPVVATDTHGIPEQVVPGQTGFLVPIEGVNELTHCLQTLINHPEMRQKMGTAGRHKYLQEFTVQKMINEIGSVYEEILTHSNLESLTASRG